jgi:hypothetical protein
MENVFDNFEPKRSNRFTVNIGEPFEIPSYLFNKAELPQYDNGNWTDLKLRSFDPIAPSVSQLIHEGLRKLRTRDNQEFSTKIDILSPVGDIVSQWVIKGHISCIDFGDWSCTNSDIVQINITIKPTSVILNY